MVEEKSNTRQRKVKWHHLLFGLISRRAADLLNLLVEDPQMNQARCNSNR